MSSPTNPAAGAAPHTAHDLAAEEITGFDVGISWKDITFAAGGREILKGLTGTAMPGRLLAIMGKSGAGKTTLLKLIADRLSREGDRTVTGSLYANGVELTSRHRALISFVPQDDILNGLGSAKETLHFNARMRCGNFPEEYTDKLVADALDELKLSHVQDTIIGVPGITSGLSGGERKRANIGAEFVHRPKVLLLDEPTTGLDSVTSERIVRLLRDLARRGRTVICTIHQPTFECMSLFDDFLLLAGGKAVYHGPMSGAVAHFSSAGFVCPRDSTPTDFFMWHVEDEVDCPKLLAAWDAHLATLKGNVNSTPLCLQAPYTAGRGDAESLAFLDKHFLQSEVPFTVQVKELFRRAFSNSMRNSMNIIATLVQAVVFGAFVGILYHALEKNTQGMADRLGMFFTLATNMGFSGASAVLNTFPAIKAVFLREQQAGAYSVLAFFVATFLADMPLQIFATVIQCVIVYFATQLVLDAGRFFVFTAVLILANQVSVSIGLALSAATPNPVIAGALIPTVMTPMLIMGGFLASTERQTPNWLWLERISTVMMPFVLMVRNELNAPEFEKSGSVWCDAGKYGLPFCQIQPKNGWEWLQAFGLTRDVDAEWISWLTLALILVVVRFLAWWALVRAASQKE
jgi:ABC-type multidrug transport system ATPase subunit